METRTATWSLRLQQQTKRREQSRNGSSLFENSKPTHSDTSPLVSTPSKPTQTGQTT